MLPDSLTLEDHESVADLHTFLARARAVADGEARLQAAGGVLAVYVSVLHPDTLGSGVPTVLGLRVAGLLGPDSGGVDAVYPLGALTDRLARMADGGTVLSLPPAESSAAWAGVSPPRSGWSRLGRLDDDVLAGVAAAGMRAVADALPENAGRPVLATVRSRIWSSPLGLAAVPDAAADAAPALPQGGAGDLPSGAAFAAWSLGFLRDGGASVLYANGRWRRLSSGGGHVLVRLAAVNPPGRV
ncbi:MAG: hypothetical protein ABWX68_14225 [Arthrobacter sp.]|uniref:hypothetical protein n=1 Tax=Arthrobacter sp. TaxID=1667 RepID=UPI00347CE077